MDELTDEQIQAMLDSDLKLSTDMSNGLEQDRIQSYRSLFEKLKREPEQSLPFNFASKITNQLKIRLKRRSDLRFNLFAAFGLVVGFIAAYLLLSIVDFKAGNQFLFAVFKFKYLLIFCSIMLLGTLVFEQRMVEKN
jgi:hypothetical protein